LLLLFLRGRGSPGECPSLGVYNGKLWRCKVKKQMLVAVVLAVLLAASARAQTTDFFKLVTTGTPQEVQAAIDKGADVKANVPEGLTPLIAAAAFNKNPDVVATLLRAGADIEAQVGTAKFYGPNGTALIWAAWFNENPEVVATLLKSGANLSATESLNGASALTCAARFNKNPKVISALLKAGADIEYGDKSGKTALIAACSENPNLEVIIILLNAGAEAKAKDDNGWTPLIYAASKSENPEVILRLLKAGADARAKNNKGYTAFDYAKYNEKLKGTNALKQLEEASK
jgi:ankyrin repeat protein